MRNAEREFVAVEKVWLRNTELTDFAKDIFDLFFRDFGPTKSGYYVSLSQAFSGSLQSAAFRRGHPAEVSFPNNLVFAFYNLSPRIYRDESGSLVNSNRKQVHHPLQNRIFFKVKVVRFWGARQLSERVCNFFQQRKDDRYPIDEITLDESIKGADFYGQVLADVIPGAFHGGVGKIAVKVLPPSELAKDLMSRSPIK